MSFKQSNYGPIRQDTTPVVIHGGSVPKKNITGSGPAKQPGKTGAIYASNLEKGRIGPAKITREFAGAMVQFRKNIEDTQKATNADAESFTRQKLAVATGIPIAIINQFETPDATIAVDQTFQKHRTTLSKFFKQQLPNISAPRYEE